jgi:hypothetical protein
MSEGAAATEKGGRHHWFKVQGMFWCTKLSNSRDEVQEACAQLVYNHAGIPEGKTITYTWSCIGPMSSHISVGGIWLGAIQSWLMYPVNGLQTTCVQVQVRNEGQWM